MAGFYTPTVTTSGFSDAVRVMDGFLPDYCVTDTNTFTKTTFVFSSAPYSEHPAGQLIGRARSLEERIYEITNTSSWEYGISWGI